MIYKLLRALMKQVQVLPSANETERLQGEITEVLNGTDFNNPDAQERLLKLLYPELKRIAAGRMRTERADHTLQPTALVNEFYLHVARFRQLSWKNRAHFLAVASSAMRRVLIDHARAHRALKRGANAAIGIDANEIGIRDRSIDAIEIHELLTRLAGEEPRMARVVELRYFGGLTNEEAAEVLDIDARTVKRDWQVARAWLRNQLLKPA